LDGGDADEAASARDDDPGDRDALDGALPVHERATRYKSMVVSMYDMIEAKKCAQPYRYSGTPMGTDRAMFPYPDLWRGDYESPYPMRYERYAGYCPRVGVAQTLPHERPFRLRASEIGRGLVIDAVSDGTGAAFGGVDALPRGGFARDFCCETAPYTRLPCYDKPLGQRGCDCVTRYGSR
jgi:hypothetical protein